MKQPFRWSSTGSHKRPIIEFYLQGFPREKALRALIDSGSNVSYLDHRIADAMDIPLDRGAMSTSDLGGTRHNTYPAVVTVYADQAEWDLPVLFADNWDYDFQSVFGLRDFFVLFKVDIDASAEITLALPRRHDGRVRRSNGFRA